MITDEQFSDLVTDVKDISQSVKHMNEKFDLMATKSELYEVKVFAQNIGFKTIRYIGLSVLFYQSLLFFWEDSSLGNFYYVIRPLYNNGNY